MSKFLDDLLQRQPKLIMSEHYKKNPISPCEAMKIKLNRFVEKKKLLSSMTLDSIDLSNLNGNIENFIGQSVQTVQTESICASADLIQKETVNN